MNQWTTNVVEQTLSQLTKLGKPFKYIGNRFFLLVYTGGGALNTDQRRVWCQKSECGRVVPEPKALWRGVSLQWCALFYVVIVINWPVWLREQLQGTPRISQHFRAHAFRTSVREGMCVISVVGLDSLHL